MNAQALAWVVELAAFIRANSRERLCDENVITVLSKKNYL